MEKKEKVIIYSSLVIFFLFLTLGYTYSFGSEVLGREIKIQFVSHTEYWKNDNGSTIITLFNELGEPVKNADCKVTIFYPDKTVFINNSTMYKSGIDDNWYRTYSLVNLPLGIYEQEITCNIKTKIIKTFQSFHLNPALEEINTIEKVNIEIITKINNSEKTIFIKINNLSTEMKNNFTSLETEIKKTLLNILNLTTKLENLEINLIGKINENEIKIENKLDFLNKNLNNLINNESKIIQNLLSGIKRKSDLLISNLTFTKNQTIWLVNNAMNNKNVSNKKFNSLNKSLSSIIDFCSNQKTNNSNLCNEVYLLNDKINLMYNEQKIVLEKLENTTSSTYEILYIGIISIMESLGIIVAQTNKIN
jgi:hypothetical protein